MNNRLVVIFGTETLSSLAWYYLEHDSPCSVPAFTVDKAYMKLDRHEGLPVVAFEDLEDHFPPGSAEILIPLGFKRINGLRKDVFARALSKGYTLASYVSSRACTWPDLHVRENTLISENAVVGPFSSIGKNCNIRSNAHISHHNRIGDHVYVAPGAVFGGKVTVGDQAVIGLGAVLRSGITVAPRSFVGAGAVVIKDTAPDCVYVGNPAKVFPKSVMEVTG